MSDVPKEEINGIFGDFFLEERFKRIQSWVFKKSIFSGHYLGRMVSIREREKEREGARERRVPFRKSQSQQNVPCVVIRRRGRIGP